MFNLDVDFERYEETPHLDHPENVEPDSFFALVALRIRRSLNLNQALHTTVAEVQQHLSAERVIISRLDVNQQGCVVAEALADNIPSVSSQKIPDLGLLQNGFTSNGSGPGSFVSAIDLSQPAQDRPGPPTLLEARATLIVPILQGRRDLPERGEGRPGVQDKIAAGSQLWGLLVIQHCSSPRQWQPTEVQFLEKLSGQVTIAIQQAELYTTAQIELIKRQQAEAEICRLNKRLEEGVGIRTAQLQTANQALEQSVGECEHLQHMLLHEKDLARVTLQSIGDGVITTDTNGRIQYLNPVAEDLTGWPLEDAKGNPLPTVFKLINEFTRRPVEDPATKVLRSGQGFNLEDHTLLVARGGTEYAIDDSVAPIRSDKGEIIGTVLIFRDVTQSRRLAHQLSWQATHDPLTGLVNRAEFERRVETALSSYRDRNEQHVLCYLDLDQFKVVNDTCGHAAGDELLRQVTTLLQQRIRATDTLGRLGGDEFGLLLQGCSLEPAAQLAETLRQLIQDFRFSWKDKAFRIGVSIGLVSIHDIGSQNSDTALSAADSACYAAKAKGRNCVHIYRANDQELAKQRGERRWIARIHKALLEERFCLYGQTIRPIAPNSTAQHCEILLRLIDESGEIVLPMAFIPAAERYDLMPTIDQWVICTFLDKYQDYCQNRQLDPDPSPCLYNINLSGASVNSTTFLNFLVEQLQCHQIPLHTICFEITETTAVSNLNQAAQFMHTLKQLGCHFALDDFGIGMSSLAYLKNLPVNYLKIDGSFIQQLAEDHVDSAIVKCLNVLSHELGIQTIAECVENTTTLERLTSIGIDYVQGHAIAKPGPLRF